jgi:16S rRNA (cytosine1402-N4)-methyltransferase
LTETPDFGSADGLMDEFHRPVLVEEVVAALLPPLFVPADAPAKDPARPATLVVDLTCGGGGHAAELIARGRPDRYLAFDRDPDALAFAAKRLEPVAAAQNCKVELIHAPFSSASEYLRARALQPNVVLADLGVSSHQLDEGSRGFSFRTDAPLDMRMDPTQGEAAHELLARLNVDEIARILRDYGDEPDAHRIATALHKTKPKTTLAMAQIVEVAMSDVQKRKIGKRVHWATKSFQALRIAVNREISELEDMLAHMPDLLAVNGRIGIITFHSLEDRLVKMAFRERTRSAEVPSDLPIVAADLPTAPFFFPAKLRKAVQASDAEVAKNARARSARLRVMERLRP